MKQAQLVEEILQKIIDSHSCSKLKRQKLRIKSIIEIGLKFCCNDKMAQKKWNQQSNDILRYNKTTIPFCLEKVCLLIRKFLFRINQLIGRQKCFNRNVLLNINYSSLHYLMHARKLKNNFGSLVEKLFLAINYIIDENSRYQQYRFTLQMISKQEFQQIITEIQKFNVLYLIHTNQWPSKETTWIPTEEEKKEILHNTTNNKILQQINGLKS